MVGPGVFGVARDRFLEEVTSELEIALIATPAVVVADVLELAANTLGEREARVECHRPAQQSASLFQNDPILRLDER